MPDFVYGPRVGSLGLAHAARLLSVHPVPDILTRQFLSFYSLARILVRFVRAAFAAACAGTRALLRSVAHKGVRTAHCYIAIDSVCRCLYSAQ